MLDSNLQQGISGLRKIVTDEISGAIGDALFQSNEYYGEPANPPVESVRFITSTLGQLYEIDAYLLIQKAEFLDNVVEGLRTLLEIHPPTLYGYATESGDSTQHDLNIRRRYSEFIDCINECITFISVLGGFRQLKNSGTGTKFTFSTRQEPNFEIESTLRRIESHGGGYRIYLVEKLGPFDLLNLASLDVILDN